MKPDKLKQLMAAAVSVERAPVFQTPPEQTAKRPDEEESRVAPAAQVPAVKPPRTPRPPKPASLRQSTPPVQQDSTPADPSRTHRTSVLLYETDILSMRKVRRILEDAGVHGVVTDSIVIRIAARLAADLSSPQTLLEAFRIVSEEDGRKKQ